ncbi:hypothetical protein FKZ61_007505 [Litorilinea aerophila]|uniref:Uncharacterized protein n=1 Tax=Litorilinea aerophila TaxID=1204385 RepID=A0A540VI05_9CHLR|nr:hypothetical protein [Litorilinea aerophila]MCC9075954.1 hypothetical protein [Litorilinea aerophila]OUC06461.1 hypothetical protein RY27_20920 [Litorilinea aerophila]GIV78688.1 MAG: hypothetical protein KatS3mg050_3082 [Litorilinea sp.]
MNLFQRLARLLGGGAGGGQDRRTLTIYVLSHRCNEPIAGNVDLLNELSQAEEGSGYAYYTRKVLHTSGERRCFDQVEVEIWFDKNKQPIHHEVKGGRWLEEPAYQAELARFQAPPDEPEAPQHPENDTDESATKEES